ncbi:TPA: delta antigen [Marmota monax deltavirus]|nr:TPA: delta antigen [Marmota monax deltavirus]
MENPKQGNSKGREETLRQWVKGRERKEELEEELRRLNKKIKKLEERNPWLGNILGMVRKRGGEEQSSPSKRPRGESMEVDGGSSGGPQGPRFSEEEKRDHRRRKALENKKKQLEGHGKKLPQEEEEELRRLTGPDEARERRLGDHGPGDVNVGGGGPRGAPGGGFVSNLQGVPESPYSRRGEGLDIRGKQEFP